MPGVFNVLSGCDIFEAGGRLWVGSMMAEVVRVPIARICEYVVVHGKRDFAHVMKVTDLKMRRLFWIIWVAPI